MRKGFNIWWFYISCLMEGMLVGGIISAIVDHNASVVSFVCVSITAMCFIAMDMIHRHYGR